jgi:hypothetical protein
VRRRRRRTGTHGGPYTRDDRAAYAARMEPPRRAALPPPPFLHASVVASPGGGLHATAPIPAGTCVLRERPQRVVARAAGGAGGGAGIGGPQSPRAADALDAGAAPDGGPGVGADNAPTAGAAAAAGAPAADDASPQTVVFGADAAGAGGVAAVCPHLSAVRHSCAPNATLHIPTRYAIDTRVILALVTLVDVPAGAEVCAARVELLAAPGARAAALRGVTGRDAACACDACAGTTPSALDAALEAVVAVAVAGSAAPPPPPPPPPAAAEYDAAVAPGGTPSERQARLVAFLTAAAPALAPTHWRLISARHELVLCLASRGEFAAAWATLRAQAAAVYAVLHPAHAEAQRVTMELASRVLSAWMRVDATAAMGAGPGSLLPRVVAAGGGGGAGRAAPSSTPAEPWVHEMVKGSELLRPYLEQGFA